MLPPLSLPKGREMLTAGSRANKCYVERESPAAFCIAGGSGAACPRYSTHLSADNLSNFGMELHMTITFTPWMFTVFDWYLGSFNSPSLIFSIA